ncbi:MAG: choice-of-anchor D domain-containing protein, partial [Candidatus Marinimicrobia bacterium]|nr:choice-of-anchor D domain-containing protein [Candidatus Neomarinimicrobiota bacterium]
MYSGTEPDLSTTLVVTKTDDTDDGVCDGDCSLREAIDVANPSDIIEIPVGIYTLGSQLLITTDITLKGVGRNSTILQAATEPDVASDRVLNISGVNVTISDMTIRHGKISGNIRGAGIRASGNLTITNSTISDNIATWVGGGIWFGGSDNITLINCTISSNSAGYGGAIFMEKPPQLILKNCTLNNNSAAYGGGLYHYADDTSPPQLTNTIIANSLSGGNSLNSVVSYGHNLDSDGTCGLTGSGDLSNVNPLLGPLQDNGGPTFTHALLVGSPAIDAGDDGSAPDTDQRGYGRNGNSDIGAFEFNGIPPASTTVLTVSPPSIDFSYVIDGETAIEQVTVKNTGTADLNVSSIAITGDDSLNFSVDTTSFTLTPGDSTVLDVSFTPDTSGSFSAALDLESDGGDESVALTGKGFEIAGDYALEFDGADDYVNCGNDNSLDYSGGLTISTWIKFNESDMRYLIVGQNPLGYNFRIKENNEFSLTHWENWAKESSGANLFPDTWYHLAVTYDEQKVSFYKNGVVLNEVSQTGSIIAGGNMYIGRYGSPAENWFNGTIDEVRIWNVART